MALGAAILVSCYVVASKVARRTIGGVEAIFWLTFFEVFVAAFLVLLFREDFLPADISGFAAPLFLALAVQIGGQGLIIAGLGLVALGVVAVLFLAKLSLPTPVEIVLANEDIYGGATSVKAGALEVTGSCNNSSVTVKAGATVAGGKVAVELDMGTPWDFFGPTSWPSSLAVTPQQRANRMLLQALMVKHGFRPLAEEWWHFTLEDEPYPDTYFDFVVE